MVRAWYIDAEPTNQQLEHHRTPPKFVTAEELFQICGVEYFSLNVNTYATDGVLDEIKRKRGFTYEDEVVCSNECLSQCEEQLKKFYSEHLHADDEIRLFTEGSGYFDVRDRNDEWIRIEVVPGDMIILPSGIYHRFTLDTKNHVTIKRFFVGKPVWTSFNRPADDMDCRKKYLEKLATTGFVAV